MGRTACFAPAQFEGSAAPGTFVRAHIRAATPTYLTADILS
jgi:tRNA A37 methylthiotransferase MiaB